MPKHRTLRHNSCPCAETSVITTKLKTFHQNSWHFTKICYIRQYEGHYIQTHDRRPKLKTLLQTSRNYSKLHDIRPKLKRFHQNSRYYAKTQDITPKHRTLRLNSKHCAKTRVIMQKLNTFHQNLLHSPIRGDNLWHFTKTQDISSKLKIFPQSSRYYTKTCYVRQYGVTLRPNSRQKTKTSKPHDIGPKLTPKRAINVQPFDFRQYEVTMRQIPRN